MKSRTMSFTAAIFFAVCGTTAISHAADRSQDTIKRVVDRAIQPVMAQYGIPGMEVSVVVTGKPYWFSYGVASKETRQPVTRDTLFEIGSVTKTFTATLASYANVGGYLSLSDQTSKYLPSLQGSKFGGVTLLSLGTHTPGGLPLQVPDTIQDNDQLLQYFKDWKPTYAPETYRTYSNPGIGTLGLITAKSMGRDFTTLVEQRLFSALGLKSSYFDVPAARMADYAQGYTKEDAPVRMNGGVLSSEAYGIKTTAADMLRFLMANMDLIKLDGNLRRAIMDTHTGYFKVGGMTQDLIWEQYPYPAALETLLDGNSPEVIYDATPVTKIKPPHEPRADTWINKTGSTNGFGAYVAFVPKEKLGIVLLANKNYPIAERVTVAYKILAALADDRQSIGAGHE